MKRKIIITDWSILITIASTTLYIVFRNLGRELGSFAFLWAPITLVLLVYTRPRIFTKKTISILLLYGVVMIGILQLILWRYMEEWNQIRILLEFYNLVIMMAILGYYKDRNDFVKLAWLSKWAVFFIVVTLISTNIALYFDPLLVRESARSGMFTIGQKELFRISGAMDYASAQSIICLIPILIYHIKRNQRMVFSPKVLVIILILILILQIRAQVFANLLVTILITILSLLGTRRLRTSIVTLTLFGILFVAVPNSVYVNMFESLSNQFSPNTEINRKLIDFSIYIENPEFEIDTEAGSRAARYPLLFEALVANPLRGDASYNSLKHISPGGHLYWMNRLALWGIPGFLFFIFVLYKIFKSISSLFDDEYRFYYYLSIATIVLLGLLKAVGGSEPWLMLIIVIPGLYYLPLLFHSKNEIVNKKVL